MPVLNENEVKLFTEVLPNVALYLRSSLGNISAALPNIAPPETREADPALDKDMAILLQSYYNLLRVIGNLSDASRLADDVPYPRANADIVGFCRQLCEKAEYLAELKGVKLTFQCEKSGHIIAMDSDSMERLLLNLLSNALKFTPRGGAVTVSLRITEQRVLLTVSDTGCGIAEDRLDTLFDRFLHAEHPDPAPYGLGLGLPLCRRIAEGHGGRIFVESSAGAGTRFTVALPNEKTTDTIVRDQGMDYAGGFNHTLMELADALPYSAFTVRNLD